MEVLGMRCKIRNYLLSNGAVECVESFADNESLLDVGVIDSVVMIGLISFIEQETKITIHEDDMTPENFDSIDAIVAYISNKQ